MARVVINPAVPDRETLDNEIARLRGFDGHPNDLPGADMPECGTTSGGAGEGAPAA
jgi:hypothetical protein